MKLTDEVVVVCGGLNMNVTRNQRSFHYKGDLNRWTDIESFVNGLIDEEGNEETKTWYQSTLSGF